MVEIIACDFKNELHRSKVVELISAYMLDKMGGEEIMPDKVRANLAHVLATHPSCMVLFAVVDGKYVGITTCFTNISTFKAKPYFNVHDVAVLHEARGLGIGRKMLERVLEIAQERDYCKVNLEVREDNASARHLYNSLGFLDSEPPMSFWTKEL